MIGRFSSTILLATILAGVFDLSEAEIIDLSYGLSSTTGSFGGDGGSATAASFNHPQSCWVSCNGEAYIADTGNYLLRKVDSSNIISTIYNGTSTVSEYSGPSAPYIVTADSIGNIYFTDNAFDVLRRMDSNMILSIIAGGGTLGSGTSTNDNGAAGTSAFLPQMGGVCTDTMGDVYVADVDYWKIKKVSASTHILTYAAGTGRFTSADLAINNGDGRQATAARTSTPYGVYVDTTNGLFFTSEASGVIRKVNLETGIIVTYAGKTGFADYSGDGGPATSALLQDGFSYVAGDRDGRIYYSNYLHANVRVIDSSGIINRFVGDNSGTRGNSGDGGEATAALLGLPFHLYVRDSMVYISDRYYNDIRSVAINVSASSSSLCIPAGVSSAPSVFPSKCPTAIPTLIPTLSPSAVPSAFPTLSPTIIPTVAPTSAVPTLTFGPSVNPTQSSRPSLKPTTSPSVRPSRQLVTLSPTARPTVTSTAPIVVISFDSSLYLHNVSASSLDVTSQSAVTSSVAVTLNISTDQVSYVSQQLIGGTRRRLSASSEVYQIEVTVNVVASTADFVDAVNRNGSYLYHLLSDTLTTAVASNAFTRTVREQSAAVGALSTLYVGHVNVTVSDFTDVTPSSVSDDDDGGGSGLSGGAIAGIVIGGVAAVVVCVWLAVCRSRKRENKVATTTSPA